MKKDPVIYLEHTLSAIEAILGFCEGMDEEAFSQSDLVQSAVIRKFEIMGEAAKRIPEDLRNAYPAIPWKRMAGFRDVLIHGYDALNIETIWETIQAQLPLAKAQFEKMLDELR